MTIARTPMTCTKPKFSVIANTLRALSAKAGECVCAKGVGRTSQFLG